MVSQVTKAEAFRAMHRGSELLILPNAWDVPSARVFEEAGFPAVATSSAGMMASLGYPDGEAMPRRELVAVTGRIAKSLSVPLSADVVAGFGATPREVMATVRKVVEAGAIGVNLEDARPSGAGLFALTAQVRKIESLRRLQRSLGIPFVINARTDVIRHGSGPPKQRFREAIRRSISYRDAGADCVYPMGLTDADSIGTFVRELACPVNVMIRPGLPSLGKLQELGVKRVSFGPAASYATMGLLRRIGRDLLDHRAFDRLVEGAITYDELNELAVPKGARSPG
jgi:2-methylisocitrate lyase-like PEP mutase family enzyme